MKAGEGEVGKGHIVVWFLSIRVGLVVCLGEGEEVSKVGLENKRGLVDPKNNLKKKNKKRERNLNWQG